MFLYVYVLNYIAAVNAMHFDLFPYTTDILVIYKCDSYEML